MTHHCIITLRLTDVDDLITSILSMRQQQQGANSQGRPKPIAIQGVTLITTTNSDNWATILRPWHHPIIGGAKVT